MYLKISGKEFEKKSALAFENSEDIKLLRNFKIELGIKVQKHHYFDFGCSISKIIIECKNHSWTKSGNIPSAKMSIWNEAMFYFCLAPNEYRKILIVRNQKNAEKNKSLVEYYLKTYPHFIPKNVEIWEYDVENDLLNKCYS
ncbi:hypothetical protein [Aquirufa ecclesiirivi]|uniref:hypothetical protein n=1 Tax=Aquirufa ecclesiirivi TaxID=2715124 RepID=UPI003BAEFCD6